MKFEFYVLNYDFNSHKVKMFNIFNNIHVQERTEKEVRKYLRSSSKYTYTDYRTHKTINGFDALCEEIRLIIMGEEWSRREYEISVGDAFETDINKLEKWDCYNQCELNIPMITREVIWQYKQQSNKKET
jgi:hypothetical protein